MTGMDAYMLPSLEQAYTVWCYQTLGLRPIDAADTDVQPSSL